MTIWTRIIAFLSCILLTGCATAGGSYDDIPVGKLEGKLIVQWIEPDVFLFIPDKKKPFKFTRNNGNAISPDRMLTDGGSIPRPLWILRNYSPWGYAPAFIIHDWLFDMKHCKLPGHEAYSYLDAADVMAEVMKTMMESKLVEIDKPTLYSMHLAVSSHIAEKLWSEGKCVPPPADFAAKKPIAEYELNFGR